MELTGLQHLLHSLVSQENYEIAELVKQRIHRVEQQLITKETWYVLRGIRFSLN